MPDIRIGYQYDSSGAAQMIRDGGRIKSTTDTAARGMDRLENETRQTGQAMATTAKQSALMNRSVGGLGSRFSRFGPQIQNASFQLQDIVVQMQMGAGASRALGQQLPQLLGGFGPLGAVLGLAAGAAASFVPLLFDMARGSDEAADSATSLKEAMEGLSDEGEDLRLKLFMLEKGINNVAVAQARMAIETLKARRAQIAATEIVGGGQSARGQERAIERQLEAIDEQIAQLNKEAITVADLAREYETLKSVREAEADAAEEARKKREKALGPRDALAEEYGFRSAFPTSLDNASTFREARFQTAALRAAREDELNKQRVEAAERAARAIAKENEKAMREIELQTERASDFFVNRFDSAFKSLITGTQTASEAFRNMAASIAADLASLVARRAIFEPIVSAIGLGSIFGDLFADGAAFQNGRVMPFADGGVVSSPTFFPMANGAGLMGEAGPEAIMPLERTSGGKLGVRASGGQNAVVNQTINVNVTGGAGGGGNPQELAKLVGRAVRNSTREALMTESRPGGMLNRSVKV